MDKPGVLLSVTIEVPPVAVFWCSLMNARVSTYTPAAKQKHTSTIITASIFKALISLIYYQLRSVWHKTKYLCLSMVFNLRNDLI